MNSILKWILNKILGHKAWAGLAVLIPIILTFLPIKSSSPQNYKINLIELDEKTSKKYQIKHHTYIKKDEDIDILKNEFKNNSFLFSMRNNTNHEILINKAKLNLYAIYGNCFQPTPIKYRLNFSLKESNYEINGTTLSVSEIEFEWDEILKSKEIELYTLSLNSLEFKKDSCIKNFAINLDLIYDNKYKVATPILGIKNNEIK